MQVSFIMMALALLSSCGSVPIKDEIFYGNKGMLGAIEFHSLTTDSRKMSFEEWMQILRTKPLICSSVTTFGDIKAAVEKLCSVCNCCSYDSKAQAEEFFNNIDRAMK